MNISTGCVNIKVTKQANCVDKNCHINDECLSCFLKSAEALYKMVNIGKSNMEKFNEWYDALPPDSPIRGAH